jgi:hypothetical protein
VLETGVGKGLTQGSDRRIRRRVQPGREWKGKERKGKERKGKERKGKDTRSHQGLLRGLSFVALKRIENETFGTKCVVGQQFNLSERQKWIV